MTNTDAERVSDIVAELRDVCMDWDGSPLPDGAEPVYIHCAQIRAAADIIEAQSKALAEVGVNSVMLEEISDALNVAVANTKRATERAQKAEAALADARAVKPLEWQSKVYRDGSETHVAAQPFGQYSLHVPRKDLGPEIWASAPLSEIRWANLDAAKSAAEADYQQRILSALVTPTPENPNG